MPLHLRGGEGGRGGGANEEKVEEEEEGMTITIALFRQVAFYLNAWCIKLLNKYFVDYIRAF